MVPTEAVLAIYAKENGQGMMFNEEPGSSTPPDAPGPGDEKPKPSLRVVK